MSLRVPASGCILPILLALGACAPQGEGAMVAAPPPTRWESDLLAARAAKDREFRDDPESPLLPEDRAEFRGLEYWPPDPSYRLAGSIRRFERQERFDIVTTAGETRPCERFGEVTFIRDGRRCRLTVFRLLDQDNDPGGSGLFLPFTDGTTGEETYPAGRYVNLDGPDGGPYVLDFNLAYNPSCAYGAPERFRCPRTPKENRLPMRVEAGERGFKPIPGGKS